MAENIVLAPITSLANTTTAINAINNNNSIITNAFTDVLARSGTAPNQMLFQLDMNSNPIINLPAPSNTTSPVRLGDLVAGQSVNTNILTGTNVFSGASNTFTNAVVFNGSTTFNGGLTLPNNSVTNAILAQAPANTIKGNNTASTANVVDLTQAQMETITNCGFLYGANHGIVADGATDNSSTLQTLLNLAATLGGIPVVLPPGRIVCSNVLIPPHCSIHGASRGAISSDGNLLPWTGTNIPGTVIYVTDTVNPVFTFNGFGSTIESLTFYWPNQVSPTAATPTVYPYAVSCPNGNNIIRNCCAVNAYNFILIQSGRVTVTDNLIGAFNIGIGIDNAQDITILHNNWFQVLWDSGLSYPQNIDTWVHTTGDAAIHIGRADGVYISNCGCFAKGTFISLVSTVTGVSNGWAVNCTWDDVTNGIFANATQELGSANGWRFCNIMGRGGAHGAHAVNLAAGGSPNPQLFFTSYDFNGSYSGSLYTNTSGGFAVFDNARGLGQQAALATPGFPASGSGQVNPFPFPCTVYLAGSITGVSINGTPLGGALDTVPVLMPLQTITVTYTGSPTWTWFGL